METEVVRLIADALADATIGVGAVLANVPRVSGDALPATPTIYDETRHDWVCLEEVPNEPLGGAENAVSLPALVVRLASAKAALMPARARPSSAAPAQTEVEAEVAIHYYTKDDSPAAAMRAGRVTLRAVRGVLNVLWHPDHVDMRKLNKVALEGLVNIESGIDFVPLEHHTIAGALIVRVRARELVAGWTP